MISNFHPVLNIVRFLLSNSILHTYLPMKMEQTECSETSAYKIQTPGNYPEESIQIKFTLEQAMKVQRGSRGAAVLFL